MSDTSFDETQEILQEEALENQQRLDEEEVEFGTADDREEERGGYGGNAEDEYESNLNFLSNGQEFGGPFHTDNTNFRPDNERIVDEETEEAEEAEEEEVEDAENPEEEGFDFDFDGAYFYGHDQEWLLYQVFFFLQKYPDVRGVEFQDFYDELEQNTGLGVNLQALAKLLNDSNQ